jgi:hypothetical protein
MQIVLLARIFDLKIEKRPLLPEDHPLFIEKRIRLFAAGAAERQRRCGRRRAGLALISVGSGLVFYGLPPGCPEGAPFNAG